MLRHLTWGALPFSFMTIGCQRPAGIRYRTVSGSWHRVFRMTGPAHWSAVDLHVHTPGSQDAHDADYGTPADIVAAAVAAGIDAIAVTDHNTAAWCDAVADAAADANLIVLPGTKSAPPKATFLPSGRRARAAR